MIDSGEALFAVCQPSGQKAKAGADEAFRSTTHISVQLQLLHGLHARPSSRFAEMARRFNGSVTIYLGDKSADATSVTALMGSGSKLGSEIEIRVVGDQSRETAVALVQLLGRMAEDGSLYNRSHDIRFPEHRSYFVGRRFVPIINGMFGLFGAAVFGLGLSIPIIIIWQPILSVNSHRQLLLIVE